MSKKVLNGAIIGMGKMGLAHGAIINSINNVRLVSVCEPSKLIKKTFSEFIPNVKIYDDYKKMLSKENLDFVFITTPPDSHVEMAIECINKNIHFFIEKPLSINSSLCKPLLKIMEEKRIINMVGYMMRYQKTFKLAKTILQNNILGEIFSFGATMYVSQLFKKGKGWRYKKNKSGGGVVMAQTTHLIDLICWYFGFPGYLTANTISPYSITTEDFTHCTFSWENGLMGWIDSSWSVYNHRMLESSLKIHGENGNLLVSDDTIKLFLINDNSEFSKGWTIISKPELENGVAMDIGGTSYSSQDEEFISTIRNGTYLDSDVISAYNNLKIIDSVYDSAKNGGRLTKVSYE
tara:strand:- start:3988 stop:5034 length:1047 start_codon:yes stop_codon:yes gene_type:complete